MGPGAAVVDRKGTGSGGEEGMILRADARAIPLRDETVQCVVTSPPYWGLRDYGVPGQLGLEDSLEEYLSNMIDVFREVRRVLRPDGTLWLNLGDCYNAYNGGSCPSSKIDDPLNHRNAIRPKEEHGYGLRSKGLKPKDLVGIPWRVAFALQADGWWLRSDIIWEKTNPMPESIKDRPTKAHEYIFLLAKSERYYYDQDAIREPHTYGVNGDHHRNVDLSRKWCPPGQKSPHNGLRKARGEKVPAGWDTGLGGHRSKAGRYKTAETPHLGGRRQAPEPGEPGAFHPLGRNKRTVWRFSTQAYRETHFATFPEEIPRLCILAGSRPCDVILDPFGGSGTTAKVALELGRRPVHVDLAYHELAKKRCHTTPAMAGLLM
jgi:site-specific DNA-methyltransferase (cytosine-N4-specific)